MKDWLNNLVGRLVARLRFSFRNQTKRQQECQSSPEISVQKFLVWTQKEAETAWQGGRTEVNLATIFLKNVGSAKTVGGRCRVDGRPTTVVVCFNEEIKRQILTTAEEDKTHKERSTAQTNGEKAQIQEALEDQWRKNGCYRDSKGNWVVPDELMWRSLPHGEDR